MIDLIHDDCMNVMREYADGHFDLAIVDPEYGIDAGNMTMGKGKNKNWSKGDWDKSPANEHYFKELFRISKNQIIWGGNYFPLPITGGWIFWDKDRRKDISFSDGELAWTSFLNTLKKLIVRYDGFIGADPDCRIHPTQKPIRLYKKLLMDYAKAGDKILDTHLGSGSIAIACHDMDFDLVGVEIDEEYYKAALKRFKAETRQLKLMQMDTAMANRIKYLKPPPIELIEDFIKELGVSERQFERFYHISQATVSKIRSGERDLPADKWRIVYEKIKPAYGFGFLHEMLDNQKNIKRRSLSKMLADDKPEMDNHGRLGRLKTK